MLRPRLAASVEELPARGLGLLMERFRCLVLLWMHETLGPIVAANALADGSHCRAPTGHASLGDQRTHRATVLAVVGTAVVADSTGLHLSGHRFL